jgi:hypothetical protein
MIRENYVSFETAKLLKEKGFNKDTYTTSMYDENGEAKDVLLLKVGEEPVLRPTLQMAMKWLREVQNIDCTPSFMLNTGTYSYIVTQIKPADVLKLCHENYESYEEACEAAIKYCLENLI